CRSDRSFENPVAKRQGIRRSVGHSFRCVPHQIAPHVETRGVSKPAATNRTEYSPEKIPRQALRAFFRANGVTTFSCRTHTQTGQMGSKWRQHSALAVRD